MKQQDVKIGEVYAAKVSGHMVPVQVTQQIDNYSIGHTRYAGLNLKTGRMVVTNAAKLRYVCAQRADGSWTGAKRLAFELKMAAGQ